MKSWLRALIGWRSRQRSLDAQLDDELQFHLDMRADELRREGVPDHLAARAARLRLGDPDLIKSRCHAARGRLLSPAARDTMFGDMAGDVREWWRGVRSGPGLSALIFSTLALGVAAVATLLAVLDAVWLRPLPFAEPERVVRVYETNRAAQRNRDRASAANMLDWRRDSGVFSVLAAWGTQPLTLRDNGVVQELETAWVTGEFFEVVGLRAALGRVLTAEDADVRARVVVLSHATWQQRFGGDPRIIGRRLPLEGELFEVVGVMPPSFTFPAPEIALWWPWTYGANVPPRHVRALQVAGRLAPGLTPTEAERRLQRTAVTLQRRHPETNAGWSVQVVPLDDAVREHGRPAALALVAAVVLTLAAALTNVAGLLLVRASDRARDLGTRVALGASTWRALRLIVTDGVASAIVSAGLGLLLARWLVDLFNAAAPPGVLTLGPVMLSAPGIVLAIGLAALGGGAGGGLAALAVRTHLAFPVRIASGRLTDAGVVLALRRTVVVLQVAAAVTLLACTTVLGRSLARLHVVDTGLTTDGAYALRMVVDEIPDFAGFYARLVERLRAVPGVAAAGAVTALPHSETSVNFDRPFYPAERPPLETRTAPEADVRISTPGVIEAIGPRLIAGRDFSDVDRAGAPRVAIVNETLARLAWPGSAGLDRDLTVDFAGIHTWRVIGIVKDVRFYGPRSAPKPEVYLPLAQAAFYRPMHVVFRLTEADGASLDLARAAVTDLDPRQAVHSVVAVEALMSRALAGDRFTTFVLAAVAALSLAQAASGLFTVMAYSVVRRRREIGLRLALGAAQGRVVAETMRESARLTAAGVVIGLGGAIVTGRVLDELLFQVSPTDPAALGATITALAMVAATASIVPARRAARIDPLITLKND